MKDSHIIMKDSPNNEKIVLIKKDSPNNQKIVQTIRI